MQLNNFNKYNRWQQLDAMQAYLNKIRPPFALPEGYISPVFYATADYLETYAIKNKGGGWSLFDTTIDHYGGYAGYVQWMQKRRKAEIARLLEEVKLVDLIGQQLEENPFLLLDIDCTQIENWQSLAQHTPSKDIIHKVKHLQKNHEALLGDWNIQYLESASGKAVNMDYFSVNITTSPNNPSTGQQFTSQQFLDYFRRNINNFVAGTKFSPYCEIFAICQQETNLWNSDNPLGVLLKLDISLNVILGGNVLGNDGVVILAENTPNYWRFMTLEAPYDSQHPVSGTRQFGIKQNANGSYNIYIRGVDRFTSRIQEIFAGVLFNDAFSAADELWKSFQKKTNQFINSNGGVSSINTPITNRVNWNKVKKVLKGSMPISDLGCK